MGVLADIEQLNLALELLRRKARVSIVHHETGVSRPSVRGVNRVGVGSGRLPRLQASVTLSARQPPVPRDDKPAISVLPRSIARRLLTNGFVC